MRLMLSNESPLVSCIMPTRDRRGFVQRAIRYFERQDYPNKELIVVDDGSDRIKDLLPHDSQVRYLALPSTKPVGTKRNLAVNIARGSIIMHWDDDDWFAPARISTQVEKLLAEDADVAALSMRYVLSLESMEFWWCRPDHHGRVHYLNLSCSTIAYRRELWEKHGPYPPLNCGEDVVFLRGLPRRSTRICRLPDDDLFLYVRHGGNTWRMPGFWMDAPDGWNRVPAPSFLTAADLQDCIELASGPAPKRAASGWVDRFRSLLFWHLPARPVAVPVHRWLWKFHG